MNDPLQKTKAQEVLTAEQQGEAALLDDILNQGLRAKSADERVQGEALLDEFLKQLMVDQRVISKDVDKTIRSWITKIDQVLSTQLNEVLHAPEFQKLEASWRGLSYLVDKSETSTSLKLRVLNVTKKEILRDLTRAAEFDQSQLFKKVYGEEFDMFGGNPYSALVGDYEFSNHPEDMELLQKISNVAAAAHAPFVSAASPELFGWDDFTNLSDVRDLAKIFERTEYVKWRSFRETEDSRYVGLCLPHVLMRLPYGSDTKPTDTFNFEEDVDGKDATKYLWGNAAYAFATRLTEAFALYHWTAAIRGVEGGGLVQGLPSHTFKTDEGDVALKCPTEVAIGERRDREFSELGFISLVHCKNTDYAAFFAAQSCNKPKKFDTPAANANARLSSQLQYIFAISRFAHYLKAMMRDKIGAFMTRKNCEDFLNRWISNYVLIDDDAGQELKAQYPLREARIDVVEIPGKPGAYKAVAFLRPHFQLDELTVSLRLVAELPQPKQQ